MPAPNQSTLSKNNEPDRRTAGEAYFSLTDKRILRKCHKEATMYRAIPFATIGASLVTLALSRRVVIARVKHTPLIVFGAAAGWMIGLLTKQSECDRRVAESLSTSRYATRVRQGIKFDKSNVYDDREESEAVSLSVE